MALRKKVFEVFTPRRHDVNESMYVKRPALEAALLRAVQGSQHILLYGESGNGKSWLYRKVLDSDVFCVAANCANAARRGSLTGEIERISFSPGSAVKTAYTESKSAGLSAVFVDASVDHSGEYKVRQKEPLLHSFEQLSDRSKGRPIVIVLENLESIFSDESLMDEMARIVLLLDDPEYASFRIKFLIVGTPSGVLEYFSKTKNLESVANRIIELPKVGGFSEAQVRELIRKGFIGELGVVISDDEVLFLTDHIFSRTMGVAQRVHEYCEHLGYKIEDNRGIYDRGLPAQADHEWLTSGLRQAYIVVEGRLNSRDTAVARRNQVIYAIGKTKTHQFDSSVIEAIIRHDFPGAVSGKSLGVGAILTELSLGDEPLLIRNHKSNQYRVRDPRYIMCIRAILYKDLDAGKVRKKNFIVG